MASIYSLPAEVLLQIFAEGILTAADFACCALTCKLFHDITSQSKVHYIFKVDHPSHPTFKLIRCLLKKPSIGERFKSITVTWHRRRPRKPQTWAAKWQWTPEEHVAIKKFCKTWDILDTYNAITSGWNSEALLPLLLGFASHLESLDYGRTVLYLMYPKPSYQEGIRIHDYCEGHTTSTWEPQCREDDGGDYYDACWFGQSLGASWFYSALYMDKPVPGLANLKHFSHSGCIDDTFWPGPYLSKVLLLPQLESASIHRSPSAGSPHSILSYQRPTEPRFPAGKKSLVKNLDLVNCLFTQEDYKALAGFTGSLEKFKCVVEDIEFCKEVADIFLQRNREKLVEESIITACSPPLSDPVVRSEDFGTDDDSYFHESYPSDIEEEEEEKEEGAEEIEQEGASDDDDGEEALVIQNMRNMREKLRGSKSGGEELTADLKILQRIIGEDRDKEEKVERNGVDQDSQSSEDEEPLIIRSMRRRKGKEIVGNHDGDRENGEDK
ncbi:hypothetical protein TWF730_009396 [Orbilia blumenaviensis]|uniref:F-box domain-containing protein n=1 Tax=Orbilia blumenaviensis TaxID=1796055 RepID=A0AAV9V1H3_9PEZI